MPAVPGVIPSIVIIPVEGVAQAVATIASQSGRIGKVTVVETIVVTVGVSFFVTNVFILRGCRGNVECIAFQLIGQGAVRFCGIATVVLIDIAKLTSVIVGICITFIIIG